MKLSHVIRQEDGYGRVREIRVFVRKHRHVPAA